MKPKAMTQKELVKYLEQPEFSDVPSWMLNKIEDEYETQTKRAEEAERRVRWLERTIIFTHTDRDIERCVFCGGRDYEDGHYEDCLLFLQDGTLKPTPEDFK